MGKKAKVVFNKEIAKEIWHIKLKAEKAVKILPAQFINVRVTEGTVPLLRRPFSVYANFGRDIELVYRVIGTGTKELAAKKPGDIVDFIGPLGNTYPKHDKKGKIIVIGGGTGSASVHFLALALKKAKQKFTLIQGARTKDMIVDKTGFKKLGSVFTTEDGSLGIKGFVTNALKKVLNDNDTIYACGPEPMIKAIKSAAADKQRVKCYASFEAYMGCGIGACVSCVIPVGKQEDFEYKRVCKDGTVFDVSEVLI